MNAIYQDSKLNLESIQSLPIDLLPVEALLDPSPTQPSLNSSLRRMVREEKLLMAVLHLDVVQDELASKTEEVEKTIARLEEEIQNRALNNPEDKRLITIASRLKMKLEKFIPRLASYPLPGCCNYSGERYLENVVAIAEKQEQIENAIGVLKDDVSRFPNQVHEYFGQALAKLKQGKNIPFPSFFHATREGFSGIVETRMIRQSVSGAAGSGTYLSCNNEGDHGYGAHAFAIDESCLIGTRGTFFTGRNPQENIFFSLWVAILKDVPISEETIAFIDTSLDDIPYVKEKLQEQNLEIPVVDRATSEAIQKVFDLSTKRRELPSFDWNKKMSDDYLPTNMYPRSEQGTFRKFAPTG